MTVIPFRRPEPKKPPAPARRTHAEFATAMAVTGLALFLLQMIWTSAPAALLGVVHLLIAVVFFQQGPRIAAGLWIALSLAVMIATGSPSPVTYALTYGAAQLDRTLG